VRSVAAAWVVLALALALAAPAHAQGKAPQPATRTRAEVDALIDKVGKTPPDWWGKAKPNFPKSLDLSWPEPAPPGPWDPNKNVGQFIWSVINENPSRWPEGPKFVTHIMTVNKDDARVVNRAMNAMAVMYHNLHEDWARAAFWWRKAGNTEDNLDLADCYWKLGCREMAEEILNRYPSDGTRQCSVSKLWSDLGETEKAIALAEEAAVQQGRPDIGYLMAGEACRHSGRFDEALVYYQKVLDAANGTRDMDRNKIRAKASLEAVCLFEAFDVKKVRPGKYKAESMGYEAPIDVEVTVGAGRIAKVEVTQHKEKQFYSALTDTPRRIIEKQSVRGVDATTGATITSEAIINATAKALAPRQPAKKK